MGKVHKVGADARMLSAKIAVQPGQRDRKHLRSQPNRPGEFLPQGGELCTQVRCLLQHAARIAKKDLTGGREGDATCFALEKLSDFLLMLLCAATLGLLAHALGISAGGMIGAMIGSGAFCVARNRQRYPAWLKTALQFGSGAYIGTRIVREILWNFDHLLIPLAIMAAGIFAFTFATSALIRRLSHLDRSTAMLISTPGGIQEMSLLSEELGADTPKVAVLHTARLVFVILFFPYIMQALLYMMGEL